MGGEELESGKVLFVGMHFRNSFNSCTSRNSLEAVTAAPCHPAFQEVIEQCDYIHESDSHPVLEPLGEKLL